jgi:hypothetical protein
MSFGESWAVETGGLVSAARRKSIRRCCEHAARSTHGLQYD